MPELDNTSPYDHQDCIDCEGTGVSQGFDFVPAVECLVCLGTGKDLGRVGDDLIERIKENELDRKR